jgi:hypothetical protein
MVRRRKLSPRFRSASEPNVIFGSFSVRRVMRCERR